MQRKELEARLGMPWSVVYNTVYMDWDAVARQGELDTFLFIEEGEAIVTKSSKTQQLKMEKYILEVYQVYINFIYI